MLPAERNNMPFVIPLLMMWSNVPKRAGPPIPKPNTRIPMCSTLEYASIRLKSFWSIRNTPAVAMENKPIKISRRDIKTVSPAALQIWYIRISARNAPLVTPPAKIVPVIPGASPYASGFQACIGASPIFVPYPTINKIQEARSHVFDKNGAFSNRILKSNVGLNPV